MEFEFPSFPILVLSLLFIITIRKRLAKGSNPNIPKLPPGPSKLPLIGNMHHLAWSLPHRRLKDLAKRIGPLMHLQLGEISMVVVSSPDMAKEILKTHDVIFAQRPFHLSASIMSYNFKDIAFAPYGAYWRQLRKICILELLSPKRVQSFRPIREEEVAKIIKSLNENLGRSVNLSEKLFALTNGIISRAAFGVKCKDLKAFISLINESMEVSGGFTVSDVFPSLTWLHVLSGMRAKIEKIHHKVDKMLESIIDVHKVSRERAEKTEEEAEEEDLVDVLLKLQQCEDLEFSITNENVKAVILDIFTAGSETSSTTVEWAMSEMLKNPRVLEKAQAEVRQIFGKKGKVDEEGIDELNFLKLVIKEVLRLHPPAPLLLPRECQEKCEIDGYEIPVKTKVVINAWALGRDPKHWTEADSFMPERFAETSIDYKGANFEYIPFGAGRRICPGIIFGMANVVLPLANMLYYFDWKLPNGAKGEDLDMTEKFGSTVRRKENLYVVPIAHQPLPA